MSRWEHVIRQFHASGCQCVLAITGGGSAAISRLLSVPGGSRSLCEAVVPYSAEAVTDFLGRRPEAFCSAETALSMASVAWKRAARLTHATQNLLGVAATSSLVSDHPKSGAHRCWIATQTDRETRLMHLTLRKGARSRIEEEAVVADLILAACADATGCPRAPLPTLVDDETIDVEVVRPDELIRETWLGTRSHAWSRPDGTVAADVEQRPVGLISGAFNPLHEGHRGLRDVASAMLGGPVDFELTILNADKPPLDFLSIESRRAQFRSNLLAISAAPLFADKARCFPQTTFIVGNDTASRLIEPRFYEDSDEKMVAALATIKAAGCRFFVAGRLMNDAFHTAEELPIPEDLRDLFTTIPESRFRVDISSSAIRKNRQQNDKD